MSNKNDSLGDRMKNYENVTRNYLTCRTPVIIRLDGKAFHTFTRGFKKPFDTVLAKTMQETMKYLCENIQGCVLGYTQSDEITLVLVDYFKLNSSAWFDYNIQKMVSVAASMATFAFNKAFFRNINASIHGIYDGNNLNDIDGYAVALCRAYEKGAMFDARAFNIPKEEVINCLIWRQQDAVRNSIQAVGQYYFSHKELQCKSCNTIQDMLLLEKGVNWSEDYPTTFKRGSCCIKDHDYDEYGVDWGDGWRIDTEIPIFTQDRDYVNKLVYVKEE